MCLWSIFPDETGLEQDQLDKIRIRTVNREGQKQKKDATLPQDQPKAFKQIGIRQEKVRTLKNIYQISSLGVQEEIIVRKYLLPTRFGSIIFKICIVARRSLAQGDKA